MKRFAILFLALCLVLAMTACDPVQMIKDKVAESVGEELPELGTLVEQLTEGVKVGQLIYEETDTVMTDENGVVTKTHLETRYSYDDNGNQTLYDTVSTSSDGTSSANRSETTYDENGRLLKTVYTNDGDTVTTEYTYDSEGRDTKTVTTYSDGTKSISTSEYDAEGRMTHSDYVGAEGDHSESTYTYDEKGNELSSEWSSSYADGSTYKSKTEQSYDENGNVLRCVNTYNDGGGNVTEYEYDADGRVLKEVYTSEDGTGYTTEYTYDANGNVIDEVSNYKNGETSTQHREYDDNGNLLRSTYESTDFHSEDVYEYDANGYMTYNRYDSRSSTEHNFNVVVCTVDDKGNTLTRAFCDSYGTSESEANTYDQNGYLIKTVSTRTSSDGSSYSCVQRCEYDFGEPLG